MEWWRWVAAGVEAVLLIVLLLLWFDTLRDRPGWSVRRAARPPAIGAIAIPLGIVAILLLPWWVGLVLIVVPAIAVTAMALAS